LSTVIEDRPTGSLAARLTHIATLSGTKTWELTDEQLKSDLVDVFRIRASIDELCARLVGAAEDRNLAALEGATSTSAWLSNLTGISKGDAKKIIDPARNLGEMVEQTRQAWAAGVVTTEQATIICKAVNTLPEWVGVEERLVAQSELLEFGKALKNDDLKRIANHILEVIDPDGAEEHLGKQLEAEENNAFGKTELSMWNAGDGMTRGKFLLPNVQAGMLKTVLEGLASPRRNDPRIYDRDGEYSDAANGTLTHNQKLGRAFCELIERVDGDSKILDLGLSKRIYDRYQRIALAKRDKGCCWSGCDRPPAWCESHHLTWHSRGGPTDLPNGALFCFYHHHLLHNGEWDARMGSDGIVEVIPPRRIDPQQKPLRHDRFNARP